VKDPAGVRGLTRRALDAAADGTWSALVTSFSLADAAGAHRALEGRTATGKLVLT
jgi:NADPH2:quinone reductase